MTVAQILIKSCSQWYSRTRVLVVSLALALSNYDCGLVHQNGAAQFP